MVTVHFKLIERGPVRLDTDRAETLETILRMCGDELAEPIGAVIVIRSGKVVSRQALVEQNDTLHVYPAMSGG